MLAGLEAWKATYVVIERCLALKDVPETSPFADLLLKLTIEAKLKASA